jgi:hypothetical protein
VYIREAHPADGWRMPSNDRDGVVLDQPRSAAEREEAAGRLCSGAAQPAGFPILIDSMDDAAAEAYSAFPDRLYIIDRDGRVAYKGGRGPVGFDPEGLEQALLLVLLQEEEREY